MQHEKSMRRVMLSGACQIMSKSRMKYEVSLGSLADDINATMSRGVIFLVTYLGECNFMLQQFVYHQCRPAAYNQVSTRETKDYLQQSSISPYLLIFLRVNVAPTYPRRT